MQTAAIIMLVSSIISGTVNMITLFVLLRKFKLLKKVMIWQHDEPKSEGLKLESLQPEIDKLRAMNCQNCYGTGRTTLAFSNRGTTDYCSLCGGSGLKQ